MGLFSNGTKPVLLKTGVTSASDGSATADLYAEVAGKKVTFSLVQGKVGDRATSGHTADPRNEFLVVKGSKVTGSVERLGQIPATGGYVYAKLKDKATELSDEHKEAFIAGIEAVGDFSVAGSLPIDDARTLAGALTTLHIEPKGLNVALKLRDSAVTPKDTLGFT